MICPIKPSKVFVKYPNVKLSVWNWQNNVSLYIICKSSAINGTNLTSNIVILLLAEVKDTGWPHRMVHAAPSPENQHHTFKHSVRGICPQLILEMDTYVAFMSFVTIICLSFVLYTLVNKPFHSHLRESHSERKNIHWFIKIDLL